MSASEGDNGSGPAAAAAANGDANANAASSRQENENENENEKSMPADDVESESEEEVSIARESDDDDDATPSGKRTGGKGQRGSMPPISNTNTNAPKSILTKRASEPAPTVASPSSSSSSSSSADVAPATILPPTHSTSSSGFPSSRRVVKEGYLKKLGAKVKSWKMRFFKLSGMVLSYHESRENQTPVLGEIHLAGTMVRAEPDSLFGLPFTFSITRTLAGQRTYYVVANDKEEMEEWLFLLKQRHSFSPEGLPLRLNPTVHITMSMNPDEAALRAIAVNKINSSYISTNADRKANAQSTLKGAVSKKKRRFVMDGFDLDLTYITNRIIAMGFPADGTESIYRNDMADVQRFLNTRHPGHYKVYNLCSERKYDHAKFENRVLEFPFDDHNNCAFEDLPFFCKDVADFLSEDDKNVAIIHCKAGKGRTGLLITIFLLYCGEWHTASEALRYYAFARTQNQKGVTIASQIRWVHYWEKYLSLSRDGIGLPKLEPLAIRKMTFSKKYPSFDYFTASCHGESWSSKDKVKDKDGKDRDASLWINETKTKEGGLEITFLTDPNTPNPHPWVFAKDFVFEFYKGKMFGGKTRIMSFWLHTQFLAMEPNYTLHLERMDIDKVSKDKGCSDFSLDLVFEPTQTTSEQSIAAIGRDELLSATPILKRMPGITSMPPTLGESIAAALTMMLEGRKMTRYVEGSKQLKQRAVEKKDIFICLREDSAATPSSDSGSSSSSTNGSSSQSSISPRRFKLCWCLESQMNALAASKPKDKASSDNVDTQSDATSSSTPAPAEYEQLLLSDIGSILVGKQADIWEKGAPGRSAIEDRCLTIRSRAATPSSSDDLSSGRSTGEGLELHLQAYSERQLALWVEGFKFLLRVLAQENEKQLVEEEGEEFASAPSNGDATQALTASSAPASSLTPSQSAPAASGRSVTFAIPEGDGGDGNGNGEGGMASSSSFDASRGRAESFAKPPPLYVPRSRSNRIISIQE